MTSSTVASTRLKVLVAVKTYPVPARKGVEVSCTAGIDDAGRWVRLFPVPFRLLGEQQQFQKYQWIEVDAVRARDGRPESWNPDWDSIRVVSGVIPTDDAWRLRKEVVFPLRSASLCALQRAWAVEHRPTLGVFRPGAIERLHINSDSAQWSPEELAKLQRQDMFLRAPSTELEKVPYKFSYEFRCAEVECGGHKLMCTDWEMGQSYRRWRARYKVGWEDKFRARYETDMIQSCDTHFYVGTIHEHPGTWIVVGLFYPPRLDPLPMFPELA